MEGDDIYSFQNMNIMTWSEPGRLPPVSPDEVVIRSRGMRKKPVSFSPEKSEAGGMSPSSPLYRILSPRPREIIRRKLFAAEETSAQNFPTVEERDKVDYVQDNLEGRPVKKLKTTEMNLNINNNDGKTGKAEDPMKLVTVLSKDQLVKVLTDLAGHDATIKTRLSELLPEEADISSQIKNLTDCGKNVFKALPKSRLTNHHDSISYSKVSVHLAAFGKVLWDDLRRLVESEHWPTVIKRPLTVIAAIKTSENYQLDVTTKKELLGMISRSSIGDPREFQSFCDSLTASLGQARLKL